MAQDCPRCGLTSPPGAQRRDCGYDFTVGRVAGSYLTNEQRALIADARRRKKIFWVALGTLAALWTLRSSQYCQGRCPRLKGARTLGEWQLELLSDS